MYNEDTNIELRFKDKETGTVGASAYGDDRCKNYDEVFTFAKRFRIWNGKTKAEQQKISEDENVPGRIIHYDYLSSRGDAVPVDR